MSWPEVSSWALKADFCIGAAVVKWTGMLRKRVPWYLVPFLIVAPLQAACRGQASSRGVTAENSCRLFFCSSVFGAEWGAFLCKNQMANKQNVAPCHGVSFKISLVLTEATVSVIEEQSDLGISDLFSSNYFKSYSTGTRRERKEGNSSLLMSGLVLLKPLNVLHCGWGNQWEKWLFSWSGNVCGKKSGCFKRERGIRVLNSNVSQKALVVLLLKRTH